MHICFFASEFQCIVYSDIWTIVYRWYLCVVVLRPQRLYACISLRERVITDTGCAACRPVRRDNYLMRRTHAYTTSRTPYVRHKGYVRIHMTNATVNL